MEAAAEARGEAHAAVRAAAKAVAKVEVSEAAKAKADLSRAGNRPAKVSRGVRAVRLRRQASVQAESGHNAPAEAATKQEHGLKD